MRLKNHGITLIETVVVLGILMLAASILSPIITTLKRRSTERKLINPIVLFLQEARFQAIREGVPFTVNFPSPTQGHYKGIVQYAPSKTPPPSGAQWNAVEGVYEVTIESILTFSPGIGLEPPYPTQITFFPEGHCISHSIIFIRVGTEEKFIVITLARSLVHVLDEDPTK